MVGTDLVFGSVPAGGSRAGAGRAGGPGGRASWGLMHPGTGGRAWVPAGSGLDLVPCSGLSVSLALLGKVWVLGLGRGAACGGRMCPGREALRQASGSMEVAGEQATKGTSGGGGGRTNFLTGYGAGAEGRRERTGAPTRQAATAHAPPPHRMHTQHQGDRKAGPVGTGGRGRGTVCHKRKQHTRKQTTKQKSVQLARGAGAEQQPPPRGQPAAGGVRQPPHPGAHGGGGRAASLTRGLLSGLVERPEEAPLMDLDLGTQAWGGGSDPEGVPAFPRWALREARSPG